MGDRRPALSHRPFRIARFGIRRGYWSSARRDVALFGYCPGYRTDDDCWTGTRRLGEPW